MGTSQSIPKITPQDRAILDMKIQRDKLKQYQKKIQVVLEREREIAREALEAGNKSLALTALRRKKYQEGLFTKTDSQLETLERLVSSIEFSLVEKDVMFGLKQGNIVLTQMHAETSLEDVEKLMGETADAVAYQQEISEMLMSQMTLDEEEAVQQELAQLQEQAIPSLPHRLTEQEQEPVHLPSPPVTEPKKETESETQEERRVAIPA